MLAKIYQPAKSTMQSGNANSRFWVLEFENRADRKIEPLMGWTSVDSTDQQVRITFESKAAAVAYAKRENIEYKVIDPRPVKRIIKTYADNFSADRKRPWTH